MANKNNIPIYITAMNRNDSLIISKLKGRIKYVFLNQKEMDNLSNSHHMTNDWIAVAEKIDTTFVVLMGKKGVAITSPYGRDIHTTDSIAITGNTLGAGELLTSCVVHYHTFEGTDISSAVELSFGHMDEIFKRVHANLGNDKAFSNNIESIFTNAEMDQLTGAYNRHGLESVYNSFTDKDDIYVLIVDIDHFKSVNDNFGHDVGDIVLKEISRLISGGLREQDFFGRKRLSNYRYFKKVFPTS